MGLGSLVMSPAVEGAVAPAALDMEALQRKLIELRGEIDAIVLQLAVLTRPAAAAYAEPAAEAPAQEATPAAAEAVPTETTAPEARLAPEAASEEAGGDLDAPSQADAPEPTETAETSLDAMPTIEKPAATLADALAACEVATGDDAAAAASIDAEATSRGPASPATEDVVPVDTTAEGPRADAEPKSDAQTAAPATMIEASAAPAPADEAAPAAEEPAAAEAEVAVAVATTVATGADVAPEPPAAAAESTTPASEAPAAATAAVISFEPRQRKEKSDIAASRPVAASRGRRVASRIAAGIVALIAAAGALVLADRGTLSGAHALPWMSPLPSYQMPWSFFGQHKRAEAAGTVYAVDGAAASEALLARYREVWPVSP
jgi:hypothetical protein